MAFYFDSFGFYKISGGSGLPTDPDKNIYVAKWDSGFTYNLETIVSYGGLFYQSIISGNTGNNPTNIAAWAEINNPGGEPPYRDNFVIADWSPDGSGGFYIDIPASVHLQGTDKFVYAFISSNDTPTENTPFGYGDFVQYSNGDVRIVSDTAFDGFLSITSFIGETPSSMIEDWVSGRQYSVSELVVYLNNLYRCTNANSDIVFNIANWQLIGSGGGTTNYNDLVNKPLLNTNNSTTQIPASAEQIQGIIDLHKVSKTGNYNDLLNLPSYSSDDVSNNSTVVGSTVTDALNALNSSIPITIPNTISLIPDQGYLFPLSTTRAYYEKVLYSPTPIFRDGANLRKYVAYYGNGTYNFACYSDDGAHWDNETQLTGVVAGYHCEAIRVNSTIHLFYWDTGVSIYSSAAIRHCTINITTNCSIATTDAPLSGNYISGVSGGGNLRAGTYGCDKAFYNASPTNNPLNPYSYQWCIIHNGTDGSQEGELFATSPDGYNFSAWNGNTEVIARGTQSPLEWDAWIGNCYVWIEGSKWYMYYAGGNGTSNGADSNFANGIGYATSNDGINWTKYENNPIFFKTYSYKSALRLYCPCVVKQDDGWILYYTAKSQTGQYRVSTAIINKLI